MIEVLIAALVLTVGILGMVGAFDSSRKLTLLSERRTAMAHRAQLELERLQTYPYSQLAMASTPAHSSLTTNPDYYVTEGSPPTYQYGENNGEAESLVPGTTTKVCASPAEAECEAVSATPSSWADGLVSGKVYDFITWHTDNNCGSECKKQENYKRLTVVVTANVPSGNHEPQRARISTFVAEP